MRALNFLALYDILTRSKLAFGTVENY
jgi:hypothetical protein